MLSRQDNTMPNVAIVLLTLLMFLLGCSARSTQAIIARDMETQLKAKLPPHDDFGYGYREVLLIGDVETGHQVRVCMLQGGPTPGQDGGIGIFDQEGRLMDWMRIEGLEPGIEGAGRIVWNASLPELVIVRKLVRSGTGLHDDCILVLSAVNRRIVEVFRGRGDLAEWSPQGWEYRITRLAIADLGEVGRNDIISMVYMLKDGVAETQSEAYSYNPTVNRFELRQASSPRAASVR